MNRDEIAHLATNDAYAISMGLQVLVSGLCQDSLTAKQRETIQHLQMYSGRLVTLIEKLTNEEEVVA